MKKRFLAYGAVAVVSVYAIAGFFGVPYAIKHLAPEKVAAASKGGGILGLNRPPLTPLPLRCLCKNSPLRHLKMGILSQLNG